MRVVKHRIFGNIKKSKISRNLFLDTIFFFFFNYEKITMDKNVFIPIFYILDFAWIEGFLEGFTMVFLFSTNNFSVKILDPIVACVLIFIQKMLSEKDFKELVFRFFYFSLTVIRKTTENYF